MDINKMTRVMRAFAEGKPVEFRAKLGNEDRAWKTASAPSWDWDTFDYRVKPDLVAVPYNRVEEVNYDSWLKAKDTPDVLCRINMVNIKHNQVFIENNGWQSLNELFEEFTYEDGSPCGTFCLSSEI